MKALEGFARYSSKRTGVKGFQTALSHILRKEGVRGLYAGVGPSVLQVLPNAALSYYAYELFKALLDVKS
jgi:Mitochondrial carrier protein